MKKPVNIGGWDYPPGVCVVANAYLVHHDPEIYPDPYAFRPERFLEEQPGTYTWIPFGGGRRRCLGASFALVEMKIVLRAILSRCEVRPGIDGAEVSRRRAITVSPNRRATTVLHDRPRCEERAPREPWPSRSRRPEQTGQRSELHRLHLEVLLQGMAAQLAAVA